MLDLYGEEEAHGSLNDFAFSWVWDACLQGKGDGWA